MKQLINIKHYQSLLILFPLVALCTASCIGPINTGAVPLSRQKDNLLYCSNSPNMPVLQKKGSGLLNISGSFGNTGSTLNGAEVQSAYAAGKNIGLQVNGFIASRKNLEQAHQNNTAYIDAAIGYYKVFKNTLSLEIYGGIGTGNTRNEHYTGYSKIKSTKLFLQPSIGYSAKNGKFKAAAGLRFSKNRFLIQEQTFDYVLEDFNATEFSQLSQHPQQFFIEPSVLLRYGWKEFQFQFQYSELIQTGGREYNMGRSRWTLGVSIPF